MSHLPYYGAMGAAAYSVSKARGADNDEALTNSMAFVVAQILAVLATPVCGLVGSFSLLAYLSPNDGDGLGNTSFFIWPVIGCAVLQVFVLTFLVWAWRNASRGPRQRRRVPEVPRYIQPF